MISIFAKVFELYFDTNLLDHRSTINPWTQEFPSKRSLNASAVRRSSATCSSSLSSRDPSSTRAFHVSRNSLTIAVPSSVSAREYLVKALSGAESETIAQSLAMNQGRDTHRRNPPIPRLCASQAISEHVSQRLVTKIRMTLTTLSGKFANSATWIPKL